MKSRCRSVTWEAQTRHALVFGLGWSQGKRGKERGKGRKGEKELTLIGSVREHWPQAIVRKGWSDISAGAVSLSLFLSLGSSSWSEGSVKCS